MRSRSRPLASLAALAAFSLCACAGSSGQAPAAGLPGRAYAGRTLAVILPDSGSIQVKGAELIAAAYPGEGGSAAAIVAREFGDAFWSGFSSAIDYVAPLRAPDSAAPPDRRVSLPAPVTYALPAHGYSAPDSAWLAQRGIAADLALAIGPLMVLSAHEEIIAPRFGGAFKVNSLVLEGWYLLWDYRKNAAIAYGRFRPKVEYKQKADARVWMKAFDKAVDAVGEATPFRGPKWYRRAG